MPILQFLTSSLTKKVLKNSQTTVLQGRVLIAILTSYDIWPNCVSFSNQYFLCFLVKNYGPYALNKNTQSKNTQFCFVFLIFLYQKVKRYKYPLFFRWFFQKTRWGYLKILLEKISKCEKTRGVRICSVTFWYSLFWVLYFFEFLFFLFCWCCNLVSHITV